MSHICVAAFERTEKFKADFMALDKGHQDAVGKALELLRTNPRACSLRLKTVKGFPKPTIYKIDLYTNHSHQLTFELCGTVAKLLCVGTHKQIDRAPR